MATNTRTAGPTFTNIAIGPGDFALCFLDDDGEWVPHSAASNAGIGNAYPLAAKETITFSLITGEEYLHVRGRGRVLVTAPTVV